MNIVSFFSANISEVLLLTWEHLQMSVMATVLASIIGVPAGILLTRYPALRKPVLGFASVMQTVPSLALLGFLIPLPFLGGIGARTAIIALVLYSLLPIIRNTYTGITGIDPAIRESAEALGMSSLQMLFRVELPLASMMILTGIRVAMVIAIGIATIAAAIGAGGLGMYIFRGVSMVDNTLILAGAIPAALLALLADFVLSIMDRLLVPAHLR